MIINNSIKKAIKLKLFFRKNKMEKIEEFLTIKEILPNQINSLNNENLFKLNVKLPEIKKKKFRLKNPENKPKLTTEDKLILLKKLENMKSSYPKGQFCSYWIRGVCWIPKEKCQFAHGMDDLNYDFLLKFSQDRKKSLVEFGEIVNNIQTFRILIDKNYFLLHEFLIANKDKIPEMQNVNHTLEEFNRSSKLRAEVRKFLLQIVFDDFVEVIFKKKFESMKQEYLEIYNLKENNQNKNLDERNLIVKNVFITFEEFDNLIKSVGLKINERTLSQSKILKKSFVDKLTKKKIYILRLMPKSSDIFDNFVKIILNDLKIMKAEELKNALPLNFKLVNQLVIKNIEQEDPFIFNYINLKNISYSEFMEELKNNAYFIENLDAIIAEKNEELKNLNSNSVMISKENYFHEENIDEIVIEFRAFLWEKYFNKLEQENYSQKYGFMSYDYVRENFFNFSNKKISYHISENSVNLIIKKILLFDKNLFFINNNFKIFFFNFSYFQNLKLSEYFQEGKLDKRCNMQDQKVQKIVQDHLSLGKAAEEENEPLSEYVSIFKILKQRILNCLNSNIKINEDSENNIIVNNYDEKKQNESEISEECKSQEIPLEESDEDDKNVDKIYKNNQSNILFKKKISVSSKYEQEEIVVVEDLSSLLYFICKAKSFSFLALDLEGRLSSKNADINLIQIFDDSSKQIFIVDVYKIMNLTETKNKQVLFECLQIIITFIMESHNITKVFHDGRKDIAALHCVFKCCASNFIDTSCIFSFIKQLDLQTEFYNIFYAEKIKLINSKNKNTKNAKSDLFFDVFFNDSTESESQCLNNSNSPKNNSNNNADKIKETFNNFNNTNNHQISDFDIANLHSLINNSSSPGLNKILEAYEPNGNVNYLKDKMHKLMGSLSIKNKLFTDRPIDKEFLNYSAMDVKFLISSLKNMQEVLKNNINSFYPEVKNLDFELICRLLSNDHMKTYCCYD
jgi:hypothetical protein